MRIIGGKYRGKKLSAPDGRETRPTSDRARESVFNVLDSRFLKEGKTWAEISVMDAFAGTGALGIEAASRGAGVLFFVEKSRQALKCLEENLAGVRRDGVRISVFSDVLFPPDAVKAVDLLFMDPPYGRGLVCSGLNALKEKGWVDSMTLCVIEAEKNEEDVLPDGFEILDVRHYGKAKILLAQKTKD